MIKNYMENSLLKFDFINNFVRLSEKLSDFL